MSGTIAMPEPVAPATGRVALLARRHRVLLLLLVIFVATWFAIGAVQASSRVAVAWPAAPADGRTGWSCRRATRATRRP